MDILGTRIQEVCNAAGKYDEPFREALGRILRRFGKELVEASMEEEKECSCLNNKNDAYEAL